MRSAVCQKDKHHVHVLELPLVVLPAAAEVPDEEAEDCDEDAVERKPLALPVGLAVSFWMVELGAPSVTSLVLFASVVGVSRTK